MRALRWAKRRMDDATARVDESYLPGRSNTCGSQGAGQRSIGPFLAYCARKMGLKQDEDSDSAFLRTSSGGEEIASRARLKTNPEPGLPGRLGRFQLRSKIGEGGMGVVYSAWDPKLNRTVAIKVLRSDEHGERAHARLFREARAMAQINHPCLISVYEVGKEKGQTFIAMEHVRGVTLEQWLKTPRKVFEIFEVFERAAEGLQAVHDAGLLHRDFKPRNVMVAESGHVKVLDFGIARKIPRTTRSTADAASRLVRRDVALPRDTGERFDSSSGLTGDFTRPGKLLGTPVYMAPEQLLQEPLSTATDQFAFAVSLYEGLNQQVPFKGNSPLEIMTSMLAGRISPWRDPSIPPGFRLAVERALRPDPQGRFPTLKDFVRACLDGLGLQTQVPSLATRWCEQGRSSDFLLSKAFLPEARGLLSRPGLLTDTQRDFLEASVRMHQRRGLQRRAFLGVVAVSLVGLSASLISHKRREEELRMASRDEVRTKMQGLLREVNSVVTEATGTLEMMNAQRDVWEPLFDRLGTIEPSDPVVQSAELVQAIEHLNAYFRPLIEGGALASSVMVASDDGMEFLAFADPDSRSFSPPHEFYSRLVHRPRYGGDAFQIFWEGSDGNAPRPRWLRVGDADIRGQRWEGYVPEKRVWFQNAATEPGRISWTAPYLFFVTKDAGVTGSIAWRAENQTRVLALDITLMDLSRITTSLDSDDIVALILTPAGNVVGFPRHEKFPGQKEVRDYLAARNASLREVTDPSASLPTVAELGIPFLVDAYVTGKNAHASEGASTGGLSTTYEFQSNGEKLWAARAEVDQGSLGFTIYVVQAPQAR